MCRAVVKGLASKGLASSAQRCGRCTAPTALAGTATCCAAALLSFAAGISIERFGLPFGVQRKGLWEVGRGG